MNHREVLLAGYTPWTVVQLGLVLLPALVIYIDQRLHVLLELIMHSYWHVLLIWRNAINGGGDGSVRFQDAKCSLLDHERLLDVLTSAPT